MALEGIIEIDSVASLSDFLQDWAKTVSMWESIPLWFRGQPAYDDKTWKLAPGVFRAKNEKIFLERRSSQLSLSPEELRLMNERDFNCAFRRRAAAQLWKGITDVEIYFLAQHHGLPTRLLDWTTNALAALFFAVELRFDQDGCVFMLSLHASGSGQDLGAEANASDLSPAPVDMRHRFLKDSIAVLFEDLPLPKQQPQILPVLPDLSMGRMLQQASCFTFHMPGAASDSLTCNASGIVRSARKLEILRELRMLGISRSTLFPDLDNLARDLRREVVLERLGHKPRPRKWMPKSNETSGNSDSQRQS